MEAVVENGWGWNNHNHGGEELTLPRKALETT